MQKTDVNNTALAILFLATAIMLIGGLAAQGTINQVYAANNGVNNGQSSCVERGFAGSTCLPGQHSNENSGKFVGNPHYNSRGCPTDLKGDPHDESCSSAEGDPHAQFQ